MTHKDIYTKFMIEYDKANVTSSYPSLTEFEVATVLDKAYNALIAQKVTGNNIRRAGFENDLKVISDLQPLIKTETFGVNKNINSPENVRYYNLPSTFLYYVQSYIINGNVTDTVQKYETIKTVKIRSLWDQLSHSVKNGALIEIDDESYFTNTRFYIENNSYHITYVYYDGVSDIYPYIQNLDSFDIIHNFDNTDAGYLSMLMESDFPTDSDFIKKCIFLQIDNILPGNAYIQKLVESQTGSIEYDGISVRPLPMKLVTHQMAELFFITPYNMPWIKNPVCYIEDGKMYIVYDSVNKPDFSKPVVLSYIQRPNTFVKNVTNMSAGSSYFTGDGGDVEFECNSTVAEELISLAVTFALENIESQRLNSKLNMRGLEA